MGLSGCTEYRIWNGMKDRCRNPNSKAYKYYGGRGIRVCERWMTFQNFLADMGRRPHPRLTLDRINNNGNYEPGNCRWTTYTVQANNKSNNGIGKKFNKVVTMLGQSKTIREWADHFRVRPAAIVSRMKKGWPEKRLGPFGSKNRGCCYDFSFVFQTHKSVMRRVRRYMKARGLRLHSDALRQLMEISLSAQGF